MSEPKSDTELTLMPEWSLQVKLTCDYVIPMMSSVLPANDVLSVSEEQLRPSGFSGKQTHVSLCVLATELTSCLRGIQLVASSHLGAAWSSSLCFNQPIAAQSGPILCSFKRSVCFMSLIQINQFKTGMFGVSD